MKRTAHQLGLPAAVLIVASMGCAKMLGDFAFTGTGGSGGTGGSASSSSSQTATSPTSSSSTRSSTSSSGTGGTGGATGSTTTTTSGTSAGTVAVVPDPWDYGSLDEGMASMEKGFDVQNQGTTSTGKITISLTGADAAQFSLGNDLCTGLILAVGSNPCTVGVTFNPSGAGARSAQLTVNGPAGVLGTAALTGVSVGALGEACAMDTDCQSGHCTDGVCCSVDAAACPGCNACNVPGKEGSCNPVVAGSDPHTFCKGVPCTTELCDGKGACQPVPAGTDPQGACQSGPCATGNCDGKGACQPAAAGTVCQTDPVCNDVSPTNSQPDSTSVPVHLCDGTTFTCPSSANGAQACPGELACAGSSCATSCATDLDCIWGYYCEGGVCKPPLAAGAACNRPRQCSNYWCENGVCQNTCAGPGDCNNSLSVCVAGPGGMNQCNNCYVNNTSDNTVCTNAGVGPTCGSDGVCHCTSNADCTRPEAPYCMPNSGWGNTCACFAWSNIPGACAYGKTCTGPGATDPWSNCKTKTGFPCGSGSECASGFCTAGNCL